MMLNKNESYSKYCLIIFLILVSSCTYKVNKYNLKLDTMKPKLNPLTYSELLKIDPSILFWFPYSTIINNNTAIFKLGLVKKTDSTQLLYIEGINSNTYNFNEDVSSNCTIIRQPTKMVVFAGLNQLCSYKLPLINLLSQFRYQ